MKNSNDNVLPTSLAADDSEGLIVRYLDAHDFSSNTVRAFRSDLSSFGRWFATRNGEPLAWARVTNRDIIDYREHSRRERNRSIATCNRALATLRSVLAWLVEHQVIPSNPAKGVKALRQQPLAPKALEPQVVRRLLREVQLRHDARAEALFVLLLFSGCRVGDAVGLTLDDVSISERKGHALFKYGKGNKERTVPLSIAARQALSAYLNQRPPMATASFFLGERGPLTTQGVRNIFTKYGLILGTRLHPHALRHTMAYQFLKDNNNDLVSLSQLLGHESVSTTARYGQRTRDQLAEATERLIY